MSEPIQAITPSQVWTGKGILEIITLCSGSNNPSTCALYDSDVEATLGRRLYDLAAVASDSQTTPNLSVPFKKGIYVDMSVGDNERVSLTIR